MSLDHIHCVPAFRAGIPQQSLKKGMAEVMSSRSPLDHQAHPPHPCQHRRTECTLDSHSGSKREHAQTLARPVNSNFCFIGYSTIPLHCGAILEQPYLDINRVRKRYGPTHGYLPAPILAVVVNTQPIIILLAVLWMFAAIFAQISKAMHLRRVSYSRHIRTYYLLVIETV
ncbi:hypothetical protein EI94DRAFT_356810 [Lactarius quietus]|nr:hypothetical protein EI94DRAFT_356810 [Lactarius quietus]